MSARRQFLKSYLVLSCLLPVPIIGLYLGCGTQMGAQNQVGPQGPDGPQGAMGAPGVDGVAGTDGSLRIYGNGSAGAHVVSVAEDWGSTPPSNLMFTDFTINSGMTLDIPSGIVIRCKGTFTNNGTINANKMPFCQ